VAVVDLDDVGLEVVEVAIPGSLRVEFPAWCGERWMKGEDGEQDAAAVTFYGVRRTYAGEGEFVAMGGGSPPCPGDEGEDEDAEPEGLPAEDGAWQCITAA
jgi:hypothetical protein